MRSFCLLAALLVACSSAGSTPPTPSPSPPSNYEPPNGSYQKPPSSYEAPTSTYDSPPGGGGSGCPPCGGQYSCTATGGGDGTELELMATANADGSCSYGSDAVDGTGVVAILECGGLVAEEDGVSWSAVGSTVTVCGDPSDGCSVCVPDEPGTPPTSGGGFDGG